MKRLLILSSSGFLGIVLMLLIFYVSAFQNNRKNHFIRLFPPHSIWLSRRVDLRVNSYYLAGVSKGDVYLANYTNFNYILYGDMALSDTAHKLLQIPYFEGVNYDKIVSKIQYPTIWLLDAVGKRFIIGNMENESFLEYKIIHGFGGFDISPDSMLIYQTYDRANNILLLNSRNPIDSTSHKSKFSLGKVGAGLYETDGNIHVMDSGRILYVYRYKNVVLSLDGNLNLVSSFKTIDSNSVAKVKAAYIASQDKITMAKPPFVVNGPNAVDGHLLYIKSPLIADNEIKRDFERAEPVDIYDLNKGVYKYSIYLPKENGKGCKSFLVRGGYLLALYDHSILSFKLNLISV